MDKRPVLVVMDVKLVTMKTLVTNRVPDVTV